MIIINLVQIVQVCFFRFLDIANPALYVRSLIVEYGIRDDDNDDPDDDVDDDDDWNENGNLTLKAWCNKQTSMMMRMMIVMVLVMMMKTI